MKSERIIITPDENYIICDAEHVSSRDTVIAAVDQFPSRDLCVRFCEMQNCTRLRWLFDGECTCGHCDNDLDIHKMILTCESIPDLERVVNALALLYDYHIINDALRMKPKQLAYHIADTGYRGDSIVELGSIELFIDLLFTAENRMIELGG